MNRSLRIAALHCPVYGAQDQKKKAGHSFTTLGDVLIMVQFRSFAVALGLSTALITGFAQAQMTLRIANLGEPDTLDPQNMSGTWENRIAGDLYLGLTTEAADASVIPGTAESWTISPDGTVYTFKIRNDANWSDGTPVTAEDFVYAYRRIMDEARRKIRLDPL
ncbi:hypothetical protein VZ95_16485, partial [Elstera litoralis]